MAHWYARMREKLGLPPRQMAKHGVAGYRRWERCYYSEIDGGAHVGMYLVEHGPELFDMLRDKLGVPLEEAARAFDEMT